MYITTWFNFFFKLTHMNFIATSLNPFCSNFFIILPTSPLWTPSGFTMIKVRSLCSAIACENNEKIDKIVAIIRHYEGPVKSGMYRIAGSRLETRFTSQIIGEWKLRIQVTSERFPSTQSHLRLCDRASEAWRIISYPEFKIQMLN